VYQDDDVRGGRPHTDEVLLVKVLVLQACYGLSDPELEFLIHDRLSFRKFLGFPDVIPDFTTVWKARERLSKAGVDKLVWSELQRQLECKGYKIKKGVIQDATFIEADTGRKRVSEEKKAEKKGEKIDYTENQLSHIDKDASYNVKTGQVHYGYKTHIKMDVKNQLIRSYEVTTASTHDSKVQLVNKKDKKAYRDKGYFGTPLPKGVKDMTMKRAVRAHPLNTRQKNKNKKISKIRSPVERPFSVIKRTFHGARTYVKKLYRVAIKEMMKLFTYNIYQLITLARAR
jgi:IS5 family transposase